ncbi:hypothetical protein K504DRAFT_522723 [Pleomassaria siparia CBS 279.74]|uniref:Uncharacterized protein n=1 Tax=Pleomassaria siparia CBS 279.74 TaxID=1314801 RepID=A0A6G1KFT9_9PLEO|nr:hypothetical protein K504DRAFT_522723 [Pleomassaria siparia CBS 279.74]
MESVLFTRLVVGPLRLLSLATLLQLTDIFLKKKKVLHTYAYPCSGSLEPTPSPHSGDMLLCLSLTDTTHFSTQRTVITLLHFQNQTSSSNIAMASLDRTNNMQTTSTLTTQAYGKNYMKACTTNPFSLKPDVKGHISLEIMPQREKRTSQPTTVVAANSFNQDTCVVCDARTPMDDRRIGHAVPPSLVQYQVPAGLEFKEPHGALSSLLLSSPLLSRQRRFKGMLSKGKQSLERGNSTRQRIMSVGRDPFHFV